MKRVFLTFVMLGLLVVVALVGTALIRDPYLIWFRPDRVLLAGDVRVIEAADAGRSGTAYTFETRIGPILALGRLERDSRILPVMSFSEASPPRYSIVNSLFALTFFRLVGLFVAMVCVAAIFYEIRKKK